MQKNHRSYFDIAISPKEVNVNNPEQVKRSSGKNLTPRYHQNYVVVQPATRLRWVLSSLPRVALSLTQGYSYFVPSEHFENVFLKN
jgi:hypothetical protein